MSDEAKARRSYAFWVVMGLLLAPVLYVLSMGPAAYLVVRTGKGLEAAQTVYAPLVWLGDASPTMRRLLGNYEHFWAKMAR